VTFWLSKIFWWFVAPGNAMVLLATLALALLLLRRPRAAAIALTPLAAFGLALLLLPMRDFVLEPLEDRFPPPGPIAHVDGIIVLGGSVNPDLSAKRGRPVVTRSVDRLIAAADLARRYPDAKLVFTGGSAALLDTEPREADVARQVFAELGLSPDRAIYDLAVGDLGLSHAALGRHLPQARLGDGALSGRLLGATAIGARGQP
jgi:uncharacterized SAM-binding protein YcdF (DUF218 family)